MEEIAINLERGKKRARNEPNWPRSIRKRNKALGKLLLPHFDYILREKIN